MKALPELHGDELEMVQVLIQHARAMFEVDKLPLKARLSFLKELAFRFDFDLVPRQHPYPLPAASSGQTSNFQLPSRNPS